MKYENLYTKILAGLCANSGIYQNEVEINKKAKLIADEAMKVLKEIKLNGQPK